MSKKTYVGDGVMLLIVFGMILFGLVMIYSASAYTARLQVNNEFHYVQRQIFTVIIGIVTMYFVSQIDYHRILQYAWLMYGISFVMLLSVLFIGTASHGQKRWIYIGSVGFQPSEFAKFTLILFLAAMCNAAGTLLKEWKEILLLFVCVMPVTMLVMVTNLSTGVIILGLSFTVIFTASRRWKPFLGLVITGVVLMGAFLKMAAYRVDRIDAWLNVENHPKGYQTRQALFAIGSGGLFGCGYGNSIQKMAYIPEAHNDMIFSIICEEWGLLGALLVIILFLLLIWRCVVDAMYARDLSGALLVIGVMTHIGLQVLINVAVVTNSIPNTGIPLPFISYGGTSLIFLMCEIGLIQNVARQGKRGIS